MCRVVWFAFVLALLLLLPCGPVLADTIGGPARVVDGDTLVLGGERVRLHGIDAPELDQRCRDARGRPTDCGAEAAALLRRLIGKAPVTCSGLERDRYDRLIARCRASETELNREMVVRGAARAFLRYSDDYAAEERQAAATGAGVWAGEAEAPWEHRQRRWQTASVDAPRDCPIKGNISGNGRIYHTPYSLWYDRTRIAPERGERWFCSEREALDAGWRSAGG